MSVVGEAKLETSPGGERRVWTWKRRLRIGAIVLVVGVLGFRLLLAILLPLAISQTAKSLGYRVSYDRLQLSLLGTNAAIWGLDVKTRDGTQQIVKAEYAYGNISSSRLFRLGLKAYRLEVDDVSLELVRKADGSIPLLQVLQQAMGAPTKATPSKPTAVSFAAPLEVSAIRLHNLGLHVRDESVAPVFDHTFRADVRISSVGAPGAPTTLEVEASTDSLFDVLRISGEAKTGKDTLEASVSFALRGMQAGVASAYLQPFGLSIADRSMSVRGAATVSLAAIAGAPGEVSGSVQLSDLALTSDAEVSASLSKVDVQIASLSPSAVHLKKVAIEKGAVVTERTGAGQMRLGSMMFAGGEPSAVARTPATVATPVPVTPGGVPFGIQIDELNIADIKLALIDRTFSPANTVAFNIDRVVATDIATKGGADATAKLDALISAPGVFSSLTASAKASPFASAPGGQFSVKLAGIRPEVLKPYLEPLGIHPSLEAGSLDFGGTVGVTSKAGEPARLAFSILNATLRDKGAELLTIPSVKVEGLALRADSTLEIGSIEGMGPVFTVSRLSGGLVSVPGATLTAQPEQVAAVEAAVVNVAKVARRTLPAIKIDKLSWGGTKIRFEDKVLEGSSPFELSDAGIEIRSLVIDPHPGAASSPGTIKAWAVAPGLADGITMTGTVTSGADGLSAKLSGVGQGLNLERLGPYLQPVGIEPTLKQGSFKLELAARVRQTASGLGGSLEIGEAELRSAGAILGAASGVSIGSVDVDSGKIAVGPIVVDKVRASASRAADGSIEAMGVRLLPGRPQAKSGGSIPDPFALMASLGDVSLKGASVRSVQLAWADAAARVPVKTDIEIAASLGAVALNRAGAAPSPFEVSVSGAGLLEKMVLKGALTIGPESLAADGVVAGTAIESTVISAYMPAGTEARFKDGRLNAAFKARLGRAQPDGLAARLDISGVDWAVGRASLFQVGQVTVDVGRVDLASGDTQIRAVEVAGIKGEVGRNADGTLDAFGFALGVPVRGSKPETKATAATASVSDIVAGSKAAPPLIGLDRLDIRVDRFTFTDRARPEAAPVVVEGAHAYLKAPMRVLGATPETNPPVVLALEAGITPVVSKVAVEIQAVPFALQPTLGVRVDVSGIDGEGIARVVPELKEFIGAADLQGAGFTTKLDAEATVRRRGPTQIDLSRGIELAFTVSDTKFVKADGTVLGGVAKIRGEGVKIDSAGGVAAKVVEVSGLSGIAWRDEQGVHAFGALIKLPANGAGPPVVQAPPEAAPAKEAVAAPTEAAVATVTPTSPEIRIERLTMSGLDFRFEDRVVQPVVMIPFNALDADIRGLSSRVLTQDVPVKFNISAGAGKVKLPKPVRGGVITGALGDLMNLGKSEESEPPELEDREFFSQCIASGNISLFPAPHGRADASISGVELSAIRGLAAAVGASVAGGVFDARADIRSVDNGKLEVHSRIVLTDLRYKEPPDGPVARYLHLSVPLDTAISAVEAPDGSITLPVNVTLTEKGVSTGEIMSAAAGAIGNVLATAVASAPVKIVTGFAGLFGDTKGETTWVEEPPMYLSYTPGVSTLDKESQAKLEEVLDRAGSDKKLQVAMSHELGNADAVLCASRSNPPAEVARELAESLRARRVELLARRIALLPAAQTQAIRANEETDALSQLRDVQVQLAGLDDAMDSLYDLLRPGADRTAGRRTRAAALELADWRLNAVRRALAKIGGAAGTSRTGIAVPRADVADVEQSRLVIHVRRRG